LRNYKLVKLIAKPIEVGKFPVSWLELISIDVSFVKFENTSGKVPESPLLLSVLQEVVSIT